MCMKENIIDLLEMIGWINYNLLELEQIFGLVDRNSFCVVYRILWDNYKRDQFVIIEQKRVKVYFYSALGADKSFFY